jgi:hypothetical protein
VKRALIRATGVSEEQKRDVSLRLRPKIERSIGRIDQRESWLG